MMSNAGNFITGENLIIDGVKLLMNEINFTLVTGAGGFLDPIIVFQFWKQEII